MVAWMAIVLTDGQRRHTGETAQNQKARPLRYQRWQAGQHASKALSLGKA